MPELPDVEHARRCLERWLLHKTLARVAASKTRLLRGSSVAALESLQGRRIENVRRHGKWLLVAFDGRQGLALHLGMTGRLSLERSRDPVRWSRAQLETAEGTRVHFQDPRMFGRLAAGSLARLRHELGLDQLGPDVWDEPPSAKVLGSALAHRRRAVKDLLMDQTVLAGLGNIQATEALWKARIHPARRAASLRLDEVRALIAAIRWTLARTLKSMGTPGDTTAAPPGSKAVFRVYGRAGETCPRCRTRLETMRIGGRQSAFCPKCQQAWRKRRR